MIVTAALCWWNETPEDLANCVRGAANVADRFIALDGAYRRYPGATIRSSDAEVEAIKETAKKVNLECLVIQPDRLWKGAVEKRSYSVLTASYDSDWICVVDADHIIHADREQARFRLANLGADVGVARFRTPADPERSVEDTIATNWHKQQIDVIADIPQFYRALPGIRAELHHWTYSAIKNGERHWLTWTGSGPKYPLVEKKNMGDNYEVEHRCLFRSKEQILAARAYYNDREMIVQKTGQEDDVPGLPEPIFDYNTIHF